MPEQPAAVVEEHHAIAAVAHEAVHGVLEQAGVEGRARGWRAPPRPASRRQSPGRGCGRGRCPLRPTRRSRRAASCRSGRESAPRRRSSASRPGSNVRWRRSAPARVPRSRCPIALVPITPSSQRPPCARFMLARVAGARVAVQVDDGAARIGEHDDAAGRLQDLLQTDQHRARRFLQLPMLLAQQPHLVIVLRRSAAAGGVDGLRAAAPPGLENDLTHRCFLERIVVDEALPGLGNRILVAGLGICG